MKAMNLQKWFVVTLLCCLMTGCAAIKSQIPVSGIGRQAVILGELGRPIGEEVTIHGHKESPTMLNGVHSFFVDILNGHKLEHPIGIDVDGIRGWPNNTEATIRGYEVGVILFEHAGDDNIAASAGDTTFKPYQVISMSFKPLEIGEESYVIKSGDTLTKIAKQYGLTVKAIVTENNLTMTRIKVGQILKIPAGNLLEPEPVLQK
jgi:hypothetical protein